MIEFHLDGRTGVSPYLQIVQQVRHALRLGLLRQGEQLPTVKDVVAQLAINPNTVLKAYRELEHDGLVAARPGVGTFVTRTLTDTSLAAHGPLRQDLQRWLAKARLAGLDDESIEALFRTSFRSATDSGNSVTAVLRAQGLGKRYRRRWALTDCTLDIPTGRVVGLVGPNGAGKSTLLNLAVGTLTPTSGTIEVLGGRPASGRGSAGQGRIRRPGHTHVRRTEHRRPSASRRAPQPGLGRRPGAGADPAARPRPGPAGREAVRRPAGAACTHPGRRQAARAAHPRRTGREPRPARPAGVPAGPHAGRCRTGAQRRAVLPPGLRRRSRLRLPDRAGRVPGAGLLATSRRCWPPTSGSADRAATRRRCPPTSR